MDRKVTRVCFVLGYNNLLSFYGKFFQKGDL